MRVVADKRHVKDKIRLVPGSAVDRLLPGGHSEGFQIISRPPGPEPLFFQPSGQSVQAIPFSPGSSGIKDAIQLPINIDRHGPGKRVAVLVPVATALMSADRTVDDRGFTQASGSSQRGDVGLANRANDAEYFILVHDVDKPEHKAYIMDQDVNCYNHCERNMP